MSLSLCAIVRDEAQFLAGMLESVRGVVDEVVIGIDARTTDRTPHIAREHGARLLAFEWHDSFAEARNLTLERARGEWILVLDADERLLPAGRVAIRDVLAGDVPVTVDGYRVLMQDTSLDDQALGLPELTSARVFRNAPDLRYVGRVHEEVRYLPDPPRTYCEVLEHGPHLQHYGADPALERERGKAERDERLLHLRLSENPDDAVAYCYLALMARADGRRLAARTFATRALECGPRTLHDERVALMEQLAGA
jgi:glycosyltransferase involved in cell wall biosynthesis